MKYKYDFTSTGRVDQFTITLNNSDNDIYLTQHITAQAKSGIFCYIYHLGSYVSLYDRGLFKF